MHKAIISGLLATSMLVSTVAQAIPLTAPQYTITEIQTKLDSGEFYNYPGVIREGINGVRVGPTGSKYLFTKTFAPGMALPEITDVVALQKALKSEAKTVLVASNEWVLPVPAVFVELGRQNGIDGIEFMGHYLEATAGISSDDFTAYAEAQTQAVISALGINAVTIDTKVLVDQGVLDELAATKIEAATLQVNLNTANARIAELTTIEANLLAEVATLSTTVESLTSRISVLDNQVESLIGINGDLQSRVEALSAAALQAQVNADRLVAENTELFTTVIAGLQTQINGLNERLSTLTATAAEVDAAYELGRIAGVASVDITSDNLAEFERGYTQGVREGGSGFREAQDYAIDTYGIQSPASADDFVNQIYDAGYNAGRGDLLADLNGFVQLERWSLNPHLNAAYQAGIASVDITSDNAAAIEAAKDTALAGFDGTHDNIVSVRADTVVNTNSNHNGVISRVTASVNGNDRASGNLVVDVAADGTISGYVTSRSGFDPISHSLSIADISATVQAEIETAIAEAYTTGYANGYSDGYADGYADGFADGVASVN